MRSAKTQKDTRSKRREPEVSAPKARRSFDPTLLGVWLLILIPPFVFETNSTDNFRLPKLWMSETFAGLALALLALRLAKLDKLSFRDVGLRLRSEPAVLAILPLCLIAVLGAIGAPHPQRTFGALGSLCIASCLLVGLALALAKEERLVILRSLCLPAAALTVIAILQFHGVVQPFGFAQELTQRLLLTSFAGGAFDLSGYLLLPALFALSELYSASTRRARTTWGLLAALFVYGIAISQTLTVILGFLAGSLILGFFCFRRYFWRLTGGLAVAGLLLVLLVGPLHARFVHARNAIADQDYNQLLSGRLDGWRVALRMLEDHPLRGVGHGAFRSEFGHNKMVLAKEGTQFFLGHRGSFFTNAHNDLLETAAELGWPGLVAAFWGIFVIFRQVWRRRASGAPPQRVGFELGMLVAMILVSLANFPFHVALIAYPWLLFLAGVLARDEELEVTEV